MSFSRWLRSNSEHYLLCAAQARVARQKGIKTSDKPRNFKDCFWRNVFVPVYYALPNGLRQFAFRLLPGSHRRSWPKQTQRPRPANQAFPTQKS